ncbi:hypothetical protein L1887_11355 [Cichorium endivia]|nr:hypothetical protein L1887_11355 [Cichorium endivia]
MTEVGNKKALPNHVETKAPILLMAPNSEFGQLRSAQTHLQLSSQITSGISRRGFHQPPPNTKTPLLSPPPTAEFPITPSIYIHILL